MGLPRGSVVLVRTLPGIRGVGGDVVVVVVAQPGSPHRFGLGAVSMGEPSHGQSAPDAGEWLTTRVALPGPLVVLPQYSSFATVAVQPGRFAGPSSQ